MVADVVSIRDPDLKQYISLLSPTAAPAPGYTSDSRLVAAGWIFVALHGQKNDGHGFIESLIPKKPGAIVASKTWLAGAGHAVHQRCLNEGVAVIEVEDTHQAHRALAALFRKKFKGRLIAVGGSAGKTTTKDFLHTLLSQRFRTMKTEASQNGEAGIPKTLERLSNQFEVAVIEVGIDAPGDMVRHVQIVQPDLALLTSIGPEHLNLLKSVEKVFAEERILFDDTWSRGGACFGPREDAWLTTLPRGHLLHLVGTEDLPDDFPVAQPVARRNGALAVAVAHHLGLTPEEIRAGLKALQLPKGRGGQFQVGALTLIADHYNSNPASLKEGLDFAQALAALEGKALHLVLGDMLDLGDQTESCHDEIMAYLRGVPFSSTLFVGPSMSAAYARQGSGFSGNIQVVAGIEGALERAQKLAELKGILLVTGSRGMTLERVIDQIAPGVLDQRSGHG